MRTNFRDLGISKELEKILNQNRITKPTPVQEQAIPELLKGKDIIAQAQTGTGKTLAFMLPIVESIDEKEPYIQALIVTPTRELAIQITNEAKKLKSVKNLNILAAYGGKDVDRQLRKLKSNVHIVIGTPGRLLDHIRRNSINLGKLKTLVLDEADEMLNMGFLEDVETIMKQTPKRRQTMMCSATMPKQLNSLAKRFMKDPVQIKVEGSDVILEEIKQVVIETTDREKQDALCKIIDEERPFMAIIFCRTKRRAKNLNNDLRSRGYNSDEIHGDLSQGKRERVMESFRKMEIQLLVATDVAARGLDIDGITHIFNYDIPEDAKSYIHRIGRTGRAGEEGKAISFVADKDRQALDAIEKKIRKTLKKEEGHSVKAKKKRNIRKQDYRKKDKRDKSKFKDSSRSRNRRKKK